MLATAGGYLAAREAEHNLLLGILGTLRDRPGVYPEPPYLAVIADRGSSALVAIRTPPHNLVLSEPGVPDERIQAAVGLLVEDLLGLHPDLPGALGPKSTAEPFARRWSAATGRAAQLAIAERIYRLVRVVPPRPPAGAWRLAADRDRALLAAWAVAFSEEAPPGAVLLPDLDGMIERWIRGIGGATYLWEVDGRPVSLVVAGSPTPHGIRIGPVYTPPAERRRGYASALTAAASEHQLSQGRRFCFLYTDLANPTSNRIYRAIGYEPVGDADQYRFE
jgi:hypothetical protein